MKTMKFILAWVTGSILLAFVLAQFDRNVLMGGKSALYPPTQFFPGNWDVVQFVDYAGGDYRLSPTSPYFQKGLDGRDIGADIPTIEALTAGVAP